MRCIDRFEKFRDDDFDKILLDIKVGHIKSGKYSHHIKIDDNKIIKGKEFFNNGKDDKSK